MLNKEPGPGRVLLGFQNAVLSNFRFLENFGLRTVQENVTFVRYESSEIFVNVYHGRASYELGVGIGRLKGPNADKEKLSIDGIVDWAGAYKAEGFGQHVMFQVGTREGVGEFVPKLASLVKKYAIPLLRNDANAWGAALELQAHRWAEYVKETNLKSVRNKAEEAWHAKDYAQLVDLYGPIRGELTQVEAKKLAYAEQQILAAESVGSRGSSSRKRR
jgi:hypothetical protein